MIPSLSKAQAIQCDTKYPVLLVHGIAYRDDIRLKTYWGGIPKALKKNGCKVYLSQTDALGTFESNAELLKIKVEQILIENNTNKINIIAHSKGGVDARYMITKLSMSDKVASLTTIATPHRGSPLADFALKLIEKNNLGMAVDKVLRVYSKVLGDINPSPLLAYNQLTQTSMANFNQEVVDVPNVYYQSYGAVILPEYPKYFQKIKNNFISKKAGENDGVVPLKSCKWGDFKGIIGSETMLGVSHFEICGFINPTGFDANGFYISIVKDLKEMGF